MSGRQGTSFLGRRKNDKNFDYQRLGAQVQNVKKSNVYVFGDDGVYEDEDVVEFEMEKIRSRRGPRNEIPKDTGSLFVERKVAEDDTLQSLSLLYGCPISELKRINNLIRDQDFYALSRVKIPVKKHSFLIDKIKEETTSNTSDVKESSERTTLVNGATCLSADEEEVLCDNTDTDSVHDMSDPETQKLFIRQLSIGQTSRSQSKEAKQFLKNMDKDLCNLTRSTRTDRDSLDEVISVLTNKSVYPLVSPKKSHLHVDGTNCGISWKTVIVLAVVIGLLVPVLFYLTYKAYYDAHHTNTDKT